LKLHTDHIKKSYKGRDVVKGVTIEVNQGEIVGLLGPNGAGKTTSFYMIVGLIKPDAGRVFVDGTDISYFPMYKRSQLGIGYLPQEVSVFRKLSVEDNILAILLDEPFAGVDPIAVEDIQSIVSELRKKNIGILITDHNVQETLSITDRAYLLFEGSILKSGTAEELAADEQVRRVYLGQNFVLRKK